MRLCAGHTALHKCLWQFSRSYSSHAFKSMAVFSVCGLPLPENEKPDTPHSLQVRHPGVCSCVKP